MKDSRYTDLVNVMTSKQQAMDNFEIQVLAMSCSFKDVEIFMIEDEDEEFFDRNCVDTDNGEKAQIRISNPYTYFNITKTAKFENIEFTGEDLFASTKLNGFSMDFMGQYGILAFMPFSKC